MKKTKSLRLFFFLFLTVTFLTVNYGISTGAVLRVDGQNGTDLPGCSGGGTWPTAFKTIKKAFGCGTSGDEFWLKEGLHTLDSPILVIETVGIYGGFSGNETQRDQRDWQTNITTVHGGSSEYGCFDLNADTTLTV